MIKLPENNREPLEPTLWSERYGACLQRYAESRLGDSHSAEELVQECFLAGWRCRKQFAGTGTEQAWLIGILKRKILDFIRRSKRCVPACRLADEECYPVHLLRGGVISSGQDEPYLKVERAEFWHLVSLCLRQLTSRQAEVFRLREIERLSTAQICDRLGISQSNVFVSLHRARVELSQSAQLRRLQNETETRDPERETDNDSNNWLSFH